MMMVTVGVVLWFIFSLYPIFKNKKTTQDILRGNLKIKKHFLFLDLLIESKKSLIMFQNRIPIETAIFVKFAISLF
jgi:hypothetical protein